MLGMHGTYEANLAMHDCDVLIAIGARFDDRVTGRLNAFSPGSKKIHIDIDPSSINKNVRVDVPIVGDCGERAEALLAGVAQGAPQARRRQAHAGVVAPDRRLAGARLPALRQARAATSSSRNTRSSGSTR